ncbi:hypothetical protein CLOSTHATH_06425 [Hungatella hathewayi DSM 13479]|uniref:Uncharacterized protein n=1 Tax=Hungatella hathewayi DSM 13479 TaxID=566550 RepID=D3AS19_9FIRM|nr:hypothetical protein CLOSTHATH_06425 [Hungatella hathewayi DSM 13479]
MIIIKFYKFFVVHFKKQVLSSLPFSSHFRTISVNAAKVFYVKSSN